MKYNLSQLSLKEFLALDSKQLNDEYTNAEPETIEKQGFQNALALFKEAALRVPAYKDFLKKNAINPDLIKTSEDFKQLPIIDKKNYLRAYPLQYLCLDGKYSNQYILSSSSGSTGEPFLWPRGEAQELEGAVTFELIFNEFFQTAKKRTLYIDCFAMGTWIAGPFVLACAQYLARKNYQVLSVTPGIDMEIAFSLFINLAPSFDQIIISGYPPLVKDFIDRGEERGIQWKTFAIKFLFAAEGFSEDWREYIHRKVGAKDDYTTSINLYGSADAAILAHETPLTTFIRKKASNRKSLLSKLFADTRMPTLTQYDPRMKYFEAIDGKIIFTTSAGIPLIRYSIGDSGGVYSYSQMKHLLDEQNYAMEKDIKQINPRYLWRLPFVYVFGRSDLTVSFYGLLIYPEHIKYCLERQGLDKVISGKFVLTIEHDEKQNPKLVIMVELKPTIKPTKKFVDELIEIVVRRLRRVNTEYGRLYLSIKDQAIPEIRLIENGNQEFFKPGVKQRWVKKA